MHQSPAIPAFATLLLAVPSAAQGAGGPAMVEIAAAYAAKVAASALFVSGRTLDSVLAEELAPDDPLTTMIRPLLKFEVDAQQKAVTCTIGAAKATARSTGALGCTLVRAGKDLERKVPDGAALPDASTVDWPLGERLPEPGAAGAVDRKALEKALDAAFAEPAGKKVRTRAVVVVHKGLLVAERYAPGYHAAMPLPGWSMTKTMVDALVGIRVRQQKLDLTAPLRVPEWPADDPRRALRLHHLLTMTSGLAWNESYDDPASDCLRMLFHSADHGAVQARQPAAHAPGTRFCYASGSTNLICRELRATFGSDAEYWAFPRQELFAPLGMRSALIETDPSGTFVGSSYGFATARDWARLGLLYAQDGVFDGKRILPEGWVAASATATPASDGEYGRHVWLDRDPDGDGPRTRGWPDLPANLLRMDGHEGQYVIVFPTEQVVVVRLGCTKAGGFGLYALLRSVLAACKR